MPRTQEENLPSWVRMVMYWLEDQVTIAFHSDTPYSSIGKAPVPTDPIFTSLQLPSLNQFLIERGFKLRPFYMRDVPRPAGTGTGTPVKDLEELEKAVEKLEEEIEGLERKIYQQSSPAPFLREVERLEAEVEEVEEDIEKLERKIRHHGSSSPFLNGEIEKLAREVEAIKGDAAELARKVESTGGTSHDLSQESATSSGQERYDLASPIGKYFFPSPSGQGTLVVSYFNIGKVKTFHSIQDPASKNSPNDNESNTRQVVNLINRNLDKLRQEGKIPLIAAMPNWLGGATCVIHGCPVVPPYPVPEGATCPSSAGLWPITLPELSTDMQGQKGEEVTVFVLDTMPDIEHNPDLLLQAAGSAGTHNLLLEEISAEKDRLASPYIKFTYQDLPDLLKEDAPDQLLTGRDIYGQLYGFKMPDHGMSVVSIVRDLAPKANIEFIRVLNDFGVGDTGTLINALQQIQMRLAEGGDLHNKPVVVNLSLVATCHDAEFPRVWFGDDCSCDAGEFAEMLTDIKRLRSPLHTVIQSLYAQGAVIVASAGNDSSVFQWHGPMESMLMPERLGPRYPAAFPEVISVGAVDGHWHATPYSNAPALPPNHNGIATYGGGIPTPVPPSGSPHLTGEKDVDSLRAVYISSLYPALSAEDDPLNYPAPNHDAWAYWSGTSFATPIITALAARVLEKIKKTSSLPPHLWSAQVQWAITSDLGQEAILTGTTPLSLQPEFSTDAGVNVSLLKAYQCSEPGESTGTEGE